jgi:hypothetical protein
MEAASGVPPSRWGVVRTLRNVTASALLSLGVGVLALWARSTSRSDQLRFNGGGGMNVISVLGVFNFWYGLRSPSPDWTMTFSSDSIKDVEARFVRITERPKIGYRTIGSAWVLFAPHWFVAIVFAALAFVLKPKPRLRFSLSDLLILMTFAAVLVAGVASLSGLPPA